MKIKATTKVQTNARATITSVPALIKHAMDIEKGDLLEWTLETKNDEPILTIELVKTE